MNDFFSNNTSARTEYSNSKIGYIQVTANILLVRLFDILCCDTVIAANSHITDKPINKKGLILEYEIGLMIRNKRISKNISSCPNVLNRFSLSFKLILFVTSAHKNIQHTVFNISEYNPFNFFAILDEEYLSLISLLISFLSY